MQRLVRATLLLTTGLALAAVAGAQNKPDVNGTWDFTIESPQRTSTPVVTLKADGEKLTGTMKGPRGELPVTGMIKGNEITLDYTINFQGNDLKITMTGAVDKDSMKGTADFGGLASGPWSAKRRQEDKSAAPATPASSSAPAASSPNISGAWIFAVETEQGSGSPTFTFKQEGEKLTGQYKGLFGEAPLEGTVKGKEVKFSIKVNAQGVEGVVVYSGMIEGDSMKGTVTLGELGSGTWTAKRQ
jgi:hypothetical protein